VSILVCAVFLFLWLASTTESFSGNPEVVVIRKQKIQRGDSDDKSCFQLCTARRKQRSQYFFGGSSTISSNSTTLPSSTSSSSLKDFLDADRQDLVRLIKSSKQRLLNKLRHDYGKYFDGMYIDSAGHYRPFYPISPDGHSMKTLKNKLMIKLLKAQLNAKRLESNVEGLCDCLSNRPLMKGINLTVDGRGSQTVETVYEKYVWATGGHSAAAAHGNMYNESYTAYMESDLTSIFASVGIDFIGRNYAMGGTGSAAEIAMCYEEIFGTDVDIFSWDYGMTDGNLATKLFFYGYRGGLSSGRPAVVGIHMNGRSRAAREGSLKALETLGMASFYSNEEEMAKQRDAIPDSSGLTDDDIAALPEYVRSFKCGGQIEKGDPYCGTAKYTDWACQGRSAKAGWHPG
jgi:hypothetical protein